jgi:hypothetical protein
VVKERRGDGNADCGEATGSGELRVKWAGPREGNGENEKENENEKEGGGGNVPWRGEEWAWVGRDFELLVEV